MNTSRITYPSLHTILFGLTMAMPLGCDPSEGSGPDRLEEHAAELELSPSQDLVEVEDADALAFDAVEPFDLEAEVVDAEVEAAGDGCTLLRPAAWYGSGVTCVEYYKAPGSPADLLPMSDGQSFITYSGLSGPGLGTGSARITCNDGAISIQKLSCSAGVIE